MNVKIIALAVAAILIGDPAVLDPAVLLIGEPVVYTVDKSTLFDVAPVGGPLCLTTPDPPLATDGDPVQVHMLPGPDFILDETSPNWWRTPPVVDGVWRLAYRSFLWAQPIAYKANSLGFDATYAQVVDQVKRFYTENPDPGVTNATAWGWDEGTSARRLATLNCLYQLRADAELIPLMAKELVVLQCPRYYGPPCNVIHNHGLMANIAIWRAGNLTGNTAWTDLAETRLNAEIPQAFDAAGFMKEQSSGYHVTNLKLWQLAADLIGGSVIEPHLVRARAAASFLYWPDGNDKFVQLGGGTGETPGIPFPGPQAATYLQDDTYGWMVGRFSWTDPLTTYYAVRYGLFRAYHGTNDRPAITWGTLGERVLVEPGSFGSDPADPYVSYQGWLNAQNHAIPARLAFRNVNVQRASSVVYSTQHAQTFTDQQWGPTRPHTRWVAVYNTDHRLLVRDTFPNDGALSLTDNTISQYFHLDPTWTLTASAAKTADFRSASGRLLHMTTTGSISSMLRGQTRPPAGWHFPSTGVRLWSYEIRIIQSGESDGTTAAETIFQVS